ncbi:MAG: AAA family ATPase [Armatimonadota bacterium]|nr:AAA family ATPase [Armatimonadota bacterium]
MDKIYVGATRQNDGKTITCIGLMAAFKKRVDKVGYIKPVGQRYVEIDGYKIDEDALLMKEVYDIEGNIADMSPVAIPHGFTEDYILRPHRDDLVNRVKEAYGNISAGKDVILIEGTGHAGVGSVFDLSNGDVSHILGSKVIIVSSGGIGRPIDEVMLNKAMFDLFGVEVLGVIVNKVQPEKYDKINSIVRKGFERKGLEVLGVVPYYPLLSNPTIAQLLEDMNGELLSGQRGLKNTVATTVIGAMPPHEALNYFTGDALLITPGTREDLILAAMSSCVVGAGKKYCVSGIVLTGGVPPHPNVMDLIRRTFIPVIMVQEDTFTVAARIDHLIVKIRSSDIDKIRATEALIEEYVDIDRVLGLMRS